MLLKIITVLILTVPLFAADIELNVVHDIRDSVKTFESETTLPTVCRINTLEYV